MRLVLGGVAQGKRNYVKTAYHISEDSARRLMVIECTPPADGKNQLFQTNAPTTLALDGIEKTKYNRFPL